MHFKNRLILKYPGTIIKVGDIVRVRIKGADLAKRQIDMELIK